MNILALDTSTNILSVAVASEDGVRRIEFDAGLKHSECLLEMIDTLMGYANLRAEDLERVACMAGPGSFTGLRIGFAAAKGLALARNIPLIAVPTLDCLAAHLSMWPGLVAPMIDAKKRQAFTAVYRQGERLTDFLDITIQDLAERLLALKQPLDDPPGIPLLLTGPAAQDFFDPLQKLIGEVLVDPSYGQSGCAALLEIAKKRIILHNERSSDNGISAAPIYIRKSDAELNLL